MIRVLATLAALTMLATSALPAYGIQCKTHGKSWRLIEGKRCWTDRWMPKAGLTWAIPIKPLPKASRPARFRAAALPRHSAPVTRVARTEPEPVGDLSEMLAAKAEAMRARLDAPRPVRTVLVGPYVEVVAQPQSIPMPRPRPMSSPQRPAALLWMPLLLMLLMVGTAAAQTRDPLRGEG